MREKKSLVIIILFTICISNTVPFGHTQEIAPSPDDFGPYEVGRIDREFKKDEYRTLPISIFYPAFESETNADPFSEDKPYPTLIFTPGMGRIEPFRYTAQYVSSWGFIYVLVKSSERAIQFDKAEDMVLTLDWLSEQNKNESFKLSGFIDEDRIGATGFSMGGAAAIVCSAADSRFKVCVPIGGGGPSYVRAAIDPSILSLDVPFFITMGTYRDERERNRTFEIYEETKIPKYLGVIIGASHGDIFYDPVFLKYVVSFLKVYLEGDEGYVSYLYGEHAQQDIDEGLIELYFDITEGEAVFELNGLSINPSSIRVGDTITVSVDCHNKGNKAGSHTVTLSIDGEVEDEKTVKLDPDGSTSVSFEVSTSDEGVYSIDVNGLSGNFEVKKPSLLEQIPGFPLESIITGLGVVIIVIWLIQRND